MHTNTKPITAIYRAALNVADDCEAQALITFSASMSRVDYDCRMFRIVISADVADAPEGLPKQIGKLVAYRIHSPWVECALEDGQMADYFYPFDAISADACSAIEDLIAVQDRVKRKLARELAYSPPENLVYVDQGFVEKEFRGQGIARAMMAELHDYLVGAPSLVFFQAIPFVSEISAPRETQAWVAERMRATKAMARHWLADEGLGFCQPGPRTHPQMVVGCWDGESLDERAHRCLFIPLERIDAASDATTADPNSLLETGAFETGISMPATRTAPEGPAIEPARMMDVFELSDAEKCRLATEDLRDSVGFRDCEIVAIAAVRDTVYAAVRNGDEITAVVLLCEDLDVGSVRFRAIGEDLGPFASKAPLSLLSQLTPPRSEFAKKWRMDCWRKAGSMRQSA